MRFPSTLLDFQAQFPRASPRHPAATGASSHPRPGEQPRRADARRPLKSPRRDAVGGRVGAPSLRSPPGTPSHSRIVVRLPRKRC
jgi:hypothetical protein